MGLCDAAFVSFLTLSLANVIDMRNVFAMDTVDVPYGILPKGHIAEATTGIQTVN